MLRQRSSGIRLHFILIITLEALWKFCVSYPERGAEPELKRTSLQWEKPFSLGLWKNWLYIFQYSFSTTVLYEYFQEEEEIFSTYDVLPCKVTEVQSFVDLAKSLCEYVCMSLSPCYKSSCTLYESSCASWVCHIQREIMFPKASTVKRLQKHFLYKSYCTQMTIACIFSTSENLFMYFSPPLPIIKHMFLSAM